MNFEWDPEKASANFEKHGVTFAEASEVFGDPLSSSVDDPDHSTDDARFLIFGQSISHKHIVVSFTEQNPSTIWIISAREMTKQEQNAYEQ
ncbi:MAG: BrnT family toxin [Proteobacteria bacterium]|nr:BrnT family toxin [Pseudomonadota bacterium]